jgi:hypothetical protein
MESPIRGKRILLVQGSTLASEELFDAFSEAGAKPYPTASVLTAFGLIERIRFDGALIDQGLHNEAFELCAELQDRNIPYVSCAGPHRLQGSAAREREARYVLWRLESLLSSSDGADLAKANVTPENRAS